MSKKEEFISIGGRANRIAMPDANIKALDKIKKLLSGKINGKIKKIESGCWEWQGATNKQGYGKCYFSGKTYMAHRLIWMVAHKEALEPDQYVCHACDNPACVNPDHLYLGDAKTNAKDAAARKLIGRVDPSILDPEYALKVRAFYNKTKDFSETAKTFDMSPADVQLIMTYEGYPWLN